MKRAWFVLMLLVGSVRLLSANPANDRCENATAIQPGVYEGETCSASRDGSSSCTPNATAADVWFKYTAPSDDTIVATTFGSNYDSALSVHTGCPGTAANQITCSDDCGNQGACVSFSAAKGSTYWIRVSGFQNYAGRFKLSLGRDAGISGHIFDSTTGVPLKDVQVLIYIQETLEFVKMVGTDNSGGYVVAGLSPGNYIVRTLNGSGYVDELYDNQTCEGVTCNPAVATTVSVTAGHFRTGTDFALDVGGKITGTVTDASTGLPLQGVEVHIHDPSNNHITLGYTDTAGHYSSYDGLPAGNYLLFAFNHARYVDQLYNGLPCPGESCTGAGGTLVPVTLGSTTSIDFPLQPGGLITGTITDSSSGLPIPGVQVLVYNSQIRRVTTGSTDIAGTYTVFDGLSTGNYLIRTNNSRSFVDELYQNVSCQAGLCDPGAGSAIPVVQGQPSTADFQLDPGGHISGTLRDASTGLPLQSIPVEILDAGNHHLQYEFTDASGNYSTSIGLATGSYFAKSLNYAGYIDQIYDHIPCVASQCTVAQGTPVPLQAGDQIPNINFDLTPGGTASGTVTAADTGLPLENVYVYLFDQSGTFQTFGYSDSCGNYTTFNGVPDGTYYLRTLNPFGLIDEVFSDVLCLDGSCSLFSGTPVSLQPGTKGIDFSLSREILLEDEFDDGVMDWQTSGGTWTEAGGALSGVAGVAKAEAVAPLPWNPSGEPGCAGGCTISVRMQMSGGRASLLAWMHGKKNFVELRMNQDSGKWSLKQIAGGIIAGRARGVHPTPAGVYYEVKLVYDGKKFSVSADGQSVLTLNSAVVPSGNVGFRIKGGSASFDRILVY